jgi:glycosyltransferase involved in cell wall biosynthesis
MHRRVVPVVKVCVVAEYYPRRRDPVLGIWAHRQALAARDNSADVRVLVLERPVPPATTLRRPWKLAGAVARMARQPGRDLLDDLEVRYVRFMAGDRTKTYTTWHERAAAPLAEALAGLRDEWPFDLIHAHYALPAGGAAAPYATENGVPLVVSVHGGDVLGPLLQNDEARAAVAQVLGGAAEVLCNSRSTLDRVAGLLPSDERLRVVHLGASAPEPLPPKRERPTIATLAHVIPRKRHADVLEALHQLDGVDWLVIGDGPELPELRRGVDASGLSERVQFTGQLAPDFALAELATAHVMALPSEDEAFGVAYVEALACGLPAIGLATEGGPREIAALGDAMLLVPPRDPQAIAAAVRRALEDPQLGMQARATAHEHFSWQRCGRDTVAAYRDALAA